MAGIDQKSALGNMLRSAVRELGDGGNGLDDVETEAVAQLCMMAFIPTGEEDPRELLRQMSDRLVDHVVTQLEKVKGHPVVGKICQFFLIEWCYRNGHLNGDWIWQWDGPGQGKLHYDPKVPLSMIALPQASTAAT